MLSTQTAIRQLLKTKLLLFGKTPGAKGEMQNKKTRALQLWFLHLY